jgi:hypothetical protein
MEILTPKCLINWKWVFEGFQMNVGGENFKYFSNKILRGKCFRIVYWWLCISKYILGELWIKLFHALNI